MNFAHYEWCKLFWFDEKLNFVFIKLKNLIRSELKIYKIKFDKIYEFGVLLDIVNDSGFSKNWIY